MNNPQDINQQTGVKQASVLKMPTSEMTEQNRIARVWDIIDKARVGMLTTQFNGGLRARPLEARADRDAGIIWFVTDVRGVKDDEIGAAHEIGLVFIDEGDRAYLSITGRAFVTRDTAKAKDIWRKTDDTWFPDGPDDPNVRVLRIEPITADLWDGPSSTAVVAFEYVKQR
ncbi:MAG: pyridoxamine 5'-phosphate oxidase family protein [Sulfuriferula sp.]